MARPRPRTFRTKKVHGKKTVYPINAPTGARKTVSTKLPARLSQMSSSAKRYGFCSRCNKRGQIILVGQGPRGADYFKCGSCGGIVDRYGRPRNPKKMNPVSPSTTSTSTDGITPDDVKGVQTTPSNVEPEIVEESKAKPEELKVPERFTADNYWKVPIPDKGAIGKKYAPLIEWGNISPYEPPTEGSIKFMDYSSEDCPDGLLPELRAAFKENRRRVAQGKDPVNVLVQGPAGTGKSLGIKKFAEETQLPYYYVPCDAGIMSKEALLGRKELVTDENGNQVTKWFDGPIVQAVKTGGILHIDEGSLLDPEVATTFHSVLDANRTLSMENIAGGKLKANPDLFVVISCNPAELGYGGTKPLSPPLKSRMTRSILLDYPPPEIEMRIIKEKAELTNAELMIHKEGATGKYAADIGAFMACLNGLRQQADEFTYVPTLREAVAFAEDIKAGISPRRSIQSVLIGKYVGEERVKAKEAIKWHE